MSADAAWCVVIVEALLKGATDGMDILTLSLGSLRGWSSTSTAVVADRIAKSGIIITAATGNLGTLGSWYTSDPASGKEVIAIGSVDKSVFESSFADPSLYVVYFESTVIPLQNATVHGADHPPITYFSGIPLNISGSLPIYATSTNTTVADDACSPLSKDTPDLSEYLVVIRRGACNFVCPFLCCSGGLRA